LEGGVNELVLETIPKCHFFAISNIHLVKNDEINDKVTGKLITMAFPSEILQILSNLKGPK